MQDDALRTKVRDYLDPHLMPSHLEADTTSVLNAITNGCEILVSRLHTRNGVAPIRISMEVILNS